MIIDAKYYCSVLSSFSDIIYDVILYGDDICSVRNAAKAMSQNNDRLVIYGTVDEPASSAYFDGKELSVAYGSDMEAFFYIIKHNVVYKLEEKNGGGFYLDEQKLTNPLRLA
jgi:hypothetical protein